MSDKPRTPCTPIGRFAFLRVFKPKEKPGKEPRFEAVMLFDGDTDLSAMKADAAQAVRDEWGDKPPKNLRNPFKDGNDVEYEGFADKVFVNLWTHDKPVVLAADKTPIGEGRLKSGDYGRVTYNCKAFDVDGNRGVTFFLRNVQKSGDGDALGGRMSADAEFDAIEGQDHLAADLSGADALFS